MLYVEHIRYIVDLLLIAALLTLSWKLKKQDRKLWQFTHNFKEILRIFSGRLAVVEKSMKEKEEKK